MTRISSVFAASGLMALLAFAGAAQANTILVDPSEDESSVSIWLNDGWCYGCYADYEISDDLDDLAADLAIGDSWTFDFFDIIVGGIGVIWDATVQATLGFDSPDAGTTGTGTGGFATFFGEISGGYLYWDQPDDILLADGSWLTVEFENILEGGFGDRTTISATVSRYGDAVAVPEPATLGLLGAGLLALGIGARRRLRA